LKVNYIKDGLVETKDNIDELDMGGLLVYPENEWRKRYRSMYIRDTKNVMKLCVIIFLIVVIPIWGLTLIRGIDPPMILFIAASSFGFIPLATVLLIFLPIILFHAKRHPTEGLYEHGAFLERTFIPYDEVVDLEMTEIKNIIVGRLEKWKLMYKPAERGKLVMDHMLVDMKLLGFEGMALLYDKVKESKTSKDPPKLVVYRGKGGVGKREYVPQTDDA
jgi:hypothetical protein